jgi:hypothetical protein
MALPGEGACASSSGGRELRYPVAGGFLQAAATRPACPGRARRTGLIVPVDDVRPGPAASPGAGADPFMGKCLYFARFNTYSGALVLSIRAPGEPMKLNPEELVVDSFQTAAADADAELAGASPLCTILPTPCTQCFVCD